MGRVMYFCHVSYVAGILQALEDCYMLVDIKRTKFLQATKRDSILVSINDGVTLIEIAIFSVWTFG